MANRQGLTIVNVSITLIEGSYSFEARTFRGHILSACGSLNFEQCLLFCRKLAGMKLEENDLVKKGLFVIIVRCHYKKVSMEELNLIW
jgi:hypothetical protein